MSKDERSFYGRISFRALCKRTKSTAKWEELEEHEREKYTDIADAARAAGVPGSIEHDLEHVIDSDEDPEHVQLAQNAQDALAAFRTYVKTGG